LSARYRIRIDYKFERHPRTRVVDPPLERRGDKPIPHMFGQKTRCLYRASKKEWNSSMIIAETILPWASLRLFYYEIWLATGEWVGGGKHPGDQDDPKGLAGG
jgi:hypothetical protein